MLKPGIRRQGHQSNLVYILGYLCYLRRNITEFFMHKIPGDCAAGYYILITRLDARIQHSLIKIYTQIDKEVYFQRKLKKGQ